MRTEKIMPISRFLCEIERCRGRIGVNYDREVIPTRRASEGVRLLDMPKGQCVKAMAPDLAVAPVEKVIRGSTPAEVDMLRYRGARNSEAAGLPRIVEMSRERG